jgi:PAS domain S-box-containing protein
MLNVSATPEFGDLGDGTIEEPLPTPAFGDPDELERLLQVELLDLAVLVADPQPEACPVIWANSRFYDRTGFDVEDVVGNEWGFLEGEYTDDDSIDLIAEVMREGKAVDLDVRLYKKDGSTFWNRVRIRSIYDEGWRLTYFLATHQMIEPADIRPVPIVSDEREKLQVKSGAMNWV